MFRSWRHPATRIRRLTRQSRDERLRSRGWYDLAARSDARAIFVGGCGRSGTTLVKALLNRHPHIACGPETSMFGLPFAISNIAPIWGISLDELRELENRSTTLIEFADVFYARFLESEGKPRWADKTPNNVRALPRLLTWFPRGVFVHVIRDGRDVACSLRRHPKERVIDGRVTPVESNNPIERCAERWLNDTSAGLAFTGHPRVLEVRYEHLVHEAEATLRDICAFIEEPNDPQMLQPIDESGDSSKRRPGEVLNNPNAVGGIQQASIGRWKRDLSLIERVAFADIAGELLVATGYAADSSWVEED